MRILVLLSFIIYVAVFVLCQQYLLRRMGVKQIHRAVVPGTLVLQSVSFVFFMLSATTMKDKSLVTFPAVRISGAVIIVLGLWLSMASQRELGKNWVGGAGIHRNHKLITSGPYKYVRHPLYAGMLISGLGIGLVALDFWYFLTAITFTGAYMCRVYLEEQMLRKKFKKRFDAYEASTGLIIPRLMKRS